MKHTCEMCGVRFERQAGSGRPRKFCTECRPVSYVQVGRTRTCQACGATFEGIASAKFCSNRCRQANRPRVPCARCGGDTAYFAGRVATAICSTCRAWTRNHTAQCRYCSKTFESKNRGGGRTKFCSKSCARRYEIASGTHTLGIRPLTPDESLALRKARNERTTRSRRARLLGVDRDDYTRSEIAERDGYVCWLCGEPVDMSLKYPHPRSASIDHFIPLSLGGDDTRANVYLAHLGENLARGNRWASCSLKLHPLATA